MVCRTEHRGVVLTHSRMQIALFVSAVVLLLNIWTGKRAGGNPVSETELANIHKVMYMLRALESRCVLLPPLRRLESQARI